VAGTTERLTILIVARNAAAFIERALGSCLPETGCPILLADDHSTDQTVALARARAGARLRVIAVPDPGGVALARQTALDAVRTPKAAWLDADDEWIPGRAARLERMLDEGDVAVEAIDLHDGPSGTWLRRLDTPAYLRTPRRSVRLFERNALPGDTQIGFRTAVFRDAGGYDQAIQGPESFDVLLRAVARGAKLVFGDTPGYRMHAYPGSLSRDLARQRAALAAALAKHCDEDIRRLYAAAGLGARVSAWALVMVAQYRDDPAAALRYIDEACPEGAGSEVLEPDGPWPLPEAWRRAFHRGTALLMMDGRDEEARHELERAESIEPTAEGLNNLGVALARCGARDAASAAFVTAAARFPGYLDATRNAASASAARITTHPLRRAPSRRDYGVT
jgi:hypothetical protein